MKLNKQKLDQLMNHVNKTNQVVVLKLYPNEQLFDSFLQLAGNERFVWNYFVKYTKMYHQLFPDAKALSRFDLVKILTRLKRQYNWLKVNDSTGLQKTVERFSASFNNMLNFYKEKKADKHSRYVGFPHFHSRRKSTLGFGGKSITNKWINKKTGVTHLQPNIEVLDKHHIRLPKIGIQYVSRTNMMNDCQIKEYRIIYKRAGFYQLILFVERDNQTSKHTGLIGGVDCNLENQCTISNGKVFKSFSKQNKIKKLVQKSIIYQRKMSRAYDRAKQLMTQDENNKVLCPRTLESFGNYWKYRRLYNHYNLLIKRAKKQYFYEIANYLIDHYDVIVFEHLNIQGMMKNHYTARAIATASWYELQQIVTYKCLWNNKLCLIVAPQYTTQMCHNCGFVNGKDNDQPITIEKRDWKCERCHKHQRRDQNAAINIKNKLLDEPQKYLHQATVKHQINKPTAYKRNDTYMWKQLIEVYSKFLIK